MAKSQDTLRRMAHHVAHDVRMLGEALDQHPYDRLAYTTWFVHCRAVMDFFGKERRDEGDIHGSDYSTERPWSQIRGDVDGEGGPYRLLLENRRPHQTQKPNTNPAQTSAVTGVA